MTGELTRLDRHGDTTPGSHHDEHRAGEGRAPGNRAPPQSGSIVQILRERATGQPDKICYTFLGDAGVEPSLLTYAALDTKARRIAAALAVVGRPGARVLLLFSHGHDFIPALYGCLYAGAIAVPTAAAMDRGLGRLVSILRDAQPTAVLTTSALRERIRGAIEDRGDFGNLHWLAVDELQTTTSPMHPFASAGGVPASLVPDAVALLQYTSGSTGDPKGVMVSHANIIANLGCLQARQRTSAQSVLLGWLPLFHDLGLIAGVFMPVYLDAPAYLMSPAAFAKRPIRWLEGIAKYRATVTGAPNFAYDLCVERIALDERKAIDLSSLRVVVNAAEPVRAATLERFAHAFGPCGLRREALYPCYGLAEATLFVTGGDPGQRPRVQAVDSASLARGQATPPTEADTTLRIVGCGTAAPGHEVVIVDPQTHNPCRPGVVGEIWIRGASVAQGYWGRAEESMRTFRALLADGGGPYLRTGDMGFLDADTLFVTGRAKDLIIVRGRNLYPTDIEATVEAAHPAMIPHGVAAFSVDVDDEESLVVVAEIARTNHDVDRNALAECIRNALAQAHEVELHELVLIARHRLHRTTSGKIQRHACREAFMSGAMEPLSVWTRPRRGAAVSDAPDIGHAPTPAALQEWLVVRLAQVLGVDRREIDIDVALERFGLASRDALTIAGDLGSRLGRELAPTLLLEADSVKSLAWRLASLANDWPDIELGSDLTPEEARSILRELERMPSDQVDRLIRERLRD